MHFEALLILERILLISDERHGFWETSKYEPKIIGIRDTMTFSTLVHYLSSYYFGRIRVFSTCKSWAQARDLRPRGVEQLRAPRRTTFRASLNYINIYFEFITRDKSLLDVFSSSRPRSRLISPVSWRSSLRRSITAAKPRLIPRQRLHLTEQYFLWFFFPTVFVILPYFFPRSAKDGESETVLALSPFRRYARFIHLEWIPTHVGTASRGTTGVRQR